MIFKSALLTDASGSIGGMTAARNRGGMYLRSRVTPVNPNTTFQQTVRSLVSALASIWVNTLTKVQRDAWTAYAEHVQVPGKLGSMITITGLNMYVRSNVPIQQAGFARLDEAPTIFDLGDYTLPVIAGTAAGQQVGVVFTDTDDWVGEDDAAMLVYVSRPQNPSVNFFKGPYRFAGSVDGDGTTPPTSPELIDAPFPFVAGQILFWRVRVIRADGRVSTEGYGGEAAIA